MLCDILGFWVVKDFDSQVTHRTIQGMNLKETEK